MVCLARGTTTLFNANSINFIDFETVFAPNLKYRLLLSEQNFAFC